MKYIRSPRSNQSGGIYLITTLLIVVILLGGLGFLFWQNFINKPVVTVNNYVACIKSAGSSVQESYPEVCVTSDGKRFTNPDQKVTQPTTAATKSFCTPIEKLCFDYPEDWNVKSESVNQENNGVTERFVINDDTGKPWLRLQTGMSGVGGACGNEDGSYIKVLKTHTSGVSGKYLVVEGTEQYYDDTAYAVGLISYNGTSKKWSIDMKLNNSKATHSIGKIDVCDAGFGVLSGRNAKIDTASSSIGALSFG